MLLGKVIALAALKERKQVTWFPSYGAAIRGGTAFCMDVVSDSEIASPYVDRCDTLFVFNQPSWEKFKNKVRTGGLVLFNSTLIKDEDAPKDIKMCKIPFSETASSLGNVCVANMVALGSFLRQKKIFKRQTVFKVFSEIAPKDKLHLVEINKQAIEKGYAA